MSDTPQQRIVRAYDYHPYKTSNKKVTGEVHRSTDARMRLTSSSRNIGRHLQDSSVWCDCRQCKKMPTDSECLCCHEYEECKEKIQPGKKCIIECEDFEIISLRKVVLDLEITKNRIRRGLSSDSGPRNNDVYRYTAYCNFISWIFDRRLGRGNRVPVPACVVSKIREKFPAVDGLYVGFKESDLF